jgi:hypothetical protein
MELYLLFFEASRAAVMRGIKFRNGSALSKNGCYNCQQLDCKH